VFDVGAQRHRGGLSDAIEKHRSPEHPRQWWPTPGDLVDELTQRAFHPASLTRHDLAGVMPGSQNCESHQLTGARAPNQSPTRLDAGQHQTPIKCEEPRNIGGVTSTYSGRALDRLREHRGATSTPASEPDYCGQ
jgi:hypothetical protein